MGQRHQIYLALPFAVKLPNGNLSNVIGLHNQWLYGQTALEQLLNALSFTANQDEYGPFKNTTFVDEAIEAFRAIYSTNVNGYYHYHHILSEECSNPDLGDNNDGITIIDARDKDQLKYCFMWLDYSDYGDKVTSYKPLPAHEYIKTYYGDEWFYAELKQKKEELDKTDLSRDEKATAIKKYAEELADHQLDCLKTCESIHKCASLLSPEEVITIFPSLADKVGQSA